MSTRRPAETWLERMSSSVPQTPKYHRVNGRGQVFHVPPWVSTEGVMWLKAAAAREGGTWKT